MGRFLSKIKGPNKRRVEEKAEMTNQSLWGKCLGNILKGGRIMMMSSANQEQLYISQFVVT